MNNTNTSENSQKISSRVLTIAPSKIFTYPTRLADAWTPRVMEISMPGQQLERAAIEITVRQGLTQPISSKTRNIFHGIATKKSAPIQMDDEYIYDSRYDPSANIAHILSNVAATLLAIKETFPKVTVILRENASNMAKNAYKTLGYPVVLTDQQVSGKILSTSVAISKDTYEGLYNSIFGNFAFEGLKKDTPERVFISRKGTRCLLNENEVEQTLQDYGFQKFYFEDIPISEQWSVTKNAKVLVGLHGAALCSLVLNNNAVKVVELFHPGYVVDMYRYMTNDIGGTWCGVTGQIPDTLIKELDVKQQPRSFATSSTKIDINSLQMALDYLGIDKK
jgi:Glycosyltransferase 61